MGEVPFYSSLYSELYGRMGLASMKSGENVGEDMVEVSFSGKKNRR